MPVSELLEKKSGRNLCQQIVWGILQLQDESNQRLLNQTKSCNEFMP